MCRGVITAPDEHRGAACLSPSEPDADVTAPAKRRRGVLGAAWRALAGAACAGGVWALTLLTFAGLTFTLHAADVTNTLVASVLFGVVGIVLGLVTGVTVGLIRSGSERVRAALVLAVVGVLTGGVGGGLSVPAVVALGAWLPPIASSSLAWALAGLIAALVCYDWAQRAQPPAQQEDEDSEEATDAAPPKRVEWLLHQHERKLPDWPLFRVLPVLVVSAFLLVGAAALAPSDAALALAAVGVLGLSVTLVMHVQEYRLRRLEARLRALERRFRGTPGEDV